MMSNLQKRAEAEIVKRHAFFVDWFTGKADDQAMEDCARSFAPDFRMIWPDAAEHQRDPVTELLRGMRNTKGDEYAIEVVIRHAVQYSPDLVLITFDEHQWTAEGKNVRRAAALFSPDDGAPEGVVWRHLQQTWVIAPKTTE